MHDMTDRNIYPYWKQQPEILAAIIEQRQNACSDFIELYREAGPDRLYLIGSGTSKNTADAAAPFMEEVLGIEVVSVSSSVPFKVYGHPMMVYISQGGSSTNTLKLMTDLSAFPAVILTGEADCEMKNRCGRQVLFGCGEEKAGPKTKGFSSSVMTLYLCALEAAKATGQIEFDVYTNHLESLQAAAKNMAGNIKAVESWFERNKEDFGRAENYVLVGKQGGFTAAAEGALKILETLKRPALAFEFEEYLHGPVMFTDSRLCGLFFITEDRDQSEAMGLLADCHRRYSPYSFPVGRIGLGKGKSYLPLLKTGASCTEVFEFVLVPQLIAARLPELMGISEGADIYEDYTKSFPTKYMNGK